MALLARGEQAEAAKELERILVLEPGHIPAQLDIAVLGLSRGQFQVALSRLDLVLQTDAINPRALFYRAMALDQLGREEEAITILSTLARESSGKYAEQARRYLEER